MTKTFLICLTFISTSCKSQQVNTTKTNEIEQTKTFENTVYEVNATDNEMLNAIQMAKNTFDEFEKALKSENPSFKNFTLKKPYESENGDENLLISPVLFNPKTNKYIGIIASKPIHTKKVKFDEIVEIERNEIVDWMYFQDNVLKGGYTLRLLRSRMTEEDRILFDKETGYKFE
jgi:uncharacterized protein YegJ (DUF2314 family)